MSISLLGQTIVTTLRLEPRYADLEVVGYSAARHAMGIYGCVAVTCRYIVPPGFEDESLRDVFEAAVAQVVSKLGPLRVGIAGQDTTKPVYVQQPSVDIRQHVEWKALDPSSSTYDSDLLRLSEHQLCQHFTDVDRRPPWKLIAIPNSAAGSLDAMFALHHAVGDGTSAALFHTHLVEALNHPEEAGAVVQGTVVAIPEKPVLVPAQEDLVRFRMSWSFLLQQLWKAMAPSWLRSFLSPVSASWTANPVTFSPMAMHMRLVTIHPSNVPVLLSACRSNGVTLTALLNALLCALLARRLPKELPRSFSATVPVSLRPFAPSPLESGLDLATAVCNLVTVLYFQFPPDVVADLCGNPAAFASSLENSDDTNIWHLSARLREQIKERIRRIPNDDPVDMLSWVSDWPTWFRQQQGGSRSCSWEVSNLGSIAGEDGRPEGRGWTIRRPMFAQPGNVNGAAFTVNVLGIRGDAISITLAWQETVMETELAEAIAADLQRCLDDFARTGTFGVLSASRI